MPGLEEARRMIRDSGLAWNRHVEAAAIITSTKESTYDDLLACLRIRGLPAEYAACALYVRTLRPKKDDRIESIILDHDDWRQYLTEQKLLPPQSMPQILNRFRLTGDGTPGEVYLADDCRLLVTHYEFGPNVYTKLAGRDAFFALMDLGFEEHCREAGLEITTPHGVGHNCFKMRAESLPAFLGLIQSFIFAHRLELKAAVKSDSRAKDWSKSWWSGDLPDAAQPQ